MLIPNLASIWADSVLSWDFSHYLVKTHKAFCRFSVKLPGFDKNQAGFTRYRPLQLSGRDTCIPETFIPQAAKLQTTAGAL